MKLTEAEINQRIDQLSKELHNATISEITEEAFTTPDHARFTTLVRIGVEANFSVLGSLAALMMARIRDGRGGKELAMSLTKEVFVSELEAMLADAESLLDEAEFELNTPEGNGTSH